MGIRRMTAVILILLGVAGLAYGGFTYTKESHHADIGSVRISMDEKQSVYIPVWLGVGAILIGGLMLLVSTKR